jgi:hypothetical protein
VNPTPTTDEGGLRKRWAVGYAVLLSCTTSLIVALYYLIIGSFGRGHQVGFLVVVCFVTVAILVSVMAAESLAWRLSRSGRRVLLAATVLFALGVLALAWVLFWNGFYPCDLPGFGWLERCRYMR